ncbi:MAG: hypothetical protein ACRCYO_17115 [Bacteroidia bacterium]
MHFSHFIINERIYLFEGALFRKVHFQIENEITHTWVLDVYLDNKTSILFESLGYSNCYRIEDFIGVSKEWVDDNYELHILHTFIEGRGIVRFSNLRYEFVKNDSGDVFIVIDAKSSERKVNVKAKIIFEGYDFSKDYINALDSEFKKAAFSRGDFYEQNLNDKFIRFSPSKKDHVSILTLCTSNLNRSKTLEVLLKEAYPSWSIKSAGLSAELVAKSGGVLVTEEMLADANIIIVMEEKHKKRIQEYTGDSYLYKIIVLDIPDIYKYMNEDLVAILKERLISV